ncbi:maleylpyruvate isomerase family mycothiol-dependent enzyme [[Mycobacterium] crassicus]|uniref:Maleylpyruvate isomerase family mycothiol-dependent enzyme n=1 Tax=[Mycobacterium] crassicus TaxID=2872309 RepID=A0ABU5XFM8_9MYCO|nr:maleylpyruvate isomerase family mycothiol-dependent enzyme [Mycolicibacter sp. MYC098]MEB3020919.1 maleylpyruvate isomerase family mycothiol-dependent enzyme [Mycolicibacter sp. MYC098]
MKFDVSALAEAERADFAALLKSLTLQQWQAPSLCAGWTVRDVVAHMLSYEELGPVGVMRRFVRGRLRFSGANAIGLAECAAQDPQQLLDLCDRSICPRGLTAAFGSRIALLDTMIHQQDIRRPLRMPRDIPDVRLVPALNFARFAPPLHVRSRIRGLRLIATDLAWTVGRGREVYGRGEALLMALAGRHGVTDELDGPGLALLHDRIGG